MTSTFGSSAREYHKAVGGDNYDCPGLEAMQGRAGCIDTASVAGHNRVHPIVSPQSLASLTIHYLVKRSKGQRGVTIHAMEAMSDS